MPVKDKDLDLDEMDTLLLNIIQGEFPISADPYGDIAERLGMAREEALRRSVSLVERGVVRKIGPFFDAKKMNCASTLCAVDVPEERIGEAAAIINSFPHVTHNYLRAGSPNVWFTVIAESKDAITGILSEISQRAGIGPIRDLPAQKTFKIKVDLKMDRPAPKDNG